MEFSEAISEHLFRLQFNYDFSSAVDSENFDTDLALFSEGLSSLLTHYQQTLNATLTDDHIRGILYFYHIHNFLTRQELDTELYLDAVTLKSIAEKFLKSKQIKIEVEGDVGTTLQLNKSFHIFAGEDVSSAEFVDGLEKVS